MSEQATVFVVDDDVTALKSAKWLLESVGLQVQSYSCPRAFLDAYDPDVPGCVILDIRMPGMSGLELQDKLVAMGGQHPVIFVTGHGDVPACSRAYKSGAFDFIQKPVNDHQLLELTQSAIELDARHRKTSVSASTLRERRSRLTSREGEVLDLLLAGKTNKQIAADLKISFPTAARHRGRVLEKMEADNEIELVRQLLLTDSNLGSQGLAT